MSQTNYERIKNAKGDAYKILNLDREATADEVKAAYKQLALEFHPDRIKLPDAKPGSFEEDLVRDYKAKAGETFKAISAAFHILNDEKKRAEYNKTSPGRNLTVATYNPRDSHRPPSRSGSYASSPSSTTPSSYGSSSAFGSSPSSISSYSTSPPQKVDPQRAALANSQRRRSSAATAARPNMQALANFDDLGASRHGPVDPYDHLQNMGMQAPHRKDPFDLFADMFGGNAPGGGGGMFDDFAGGNRMTQPRTRRNSMGGAGGAPMDPFAAMMNGMGMGGDAFGMSPEGADDPFAKMFDGLSMGGEGKSPGQRGGFAHYKQTKRHRDRYGNVTASMQSKSVAVYDGGPAGQICVENTMKVQGFRPASRTGSAGGSRVENVPEYPDHRSYTPQPQSQPRRSYQPERSFTAPVMPQSQVAAPASASYSSSPYQARPAPAPQQSLARRMSTSSSQPGNPYLPRLPSSGAPLGIEPPAYRWAYSSPMLTNGPTEYGSSAGRRAQIGW